jgi:hypothetical protein
MENEIKAQLQALESKLDAIYTSVDKTRKYFLLIMWVSVAFVVVPAIGLLLVIPAFISSYTASLEGLL